MAAPYPFQHPDRQSILAEVHARPVDIIEEVTRVRRLVFSVPRRAGAMDAIFTALANLCTANDATPPPRETRQFGFTTEARTVTWEFHTEFVTVTWRAAINDRENWPTDIGMEALGDAMLVGATRIDVIGDDEIPKRLLPQFELSSLCVADIGRGPGQVATDFVVDQDGYTRLEFAAGRLNTLRRSIMVRRLLEIDTYRWMALLALPLARTAGPDLGRAEAELSTLIGQLSEATTADRVQAALSALHALSVRSGQLSERLGYRFAASHAYGEILHARLASLDEISTPDGSSLSRFLANRVDPALATCTAMEKRLTVLGAKIASAIELLNVRIGLDMQIQNQTVLETIANTAQSQFRLQRTVEGLSVIAIAYYLLGIMSYTLAGPLEQLGFDKTWALSVTAPIAVLVVWWFVRAIRKSHFDGR